MYLLSLRCNCIFFSMVLSFHFLDSAYLFGWMDKLTWHQPKMKHRKKVAVRLWGLFGEWPKILRLRMMDGLFWQVGWPMIFGAHLFWHRISLKLKWDMIQDSEKAMVLLSISHLTEGSGRCETKCDQNCSRLKVPLLGIGLSSLPGSQWQMKVRLGPSTKNRIILVVTGILGRGTTQVGDEISP